MSAPTTLQHRLRQRHVTCLSLFQQSVRDESATLDTEAIERMTQVRQFMADSRGESDAVVLRCEADLADRRVLLVEAEAKHNTMEVGDIVVPHSSPVHPASDNHFVETLSMREERLENERLAVLHAAARLHELHHERLQAAEEAGIALNEIEERRRTTVKQKMEQLLVDLSAIAYVSVESSLLLVQRAVLSVNSELLSNHITAGHLLTQLKRQELLQERDRMKRVSAVYDEMAHIQCRDVVLWTKATLCSAYFRAPQCRSIILSQVKKLLAEAKRDVNAFVTGFKTLIGTLEVRHPGHLTVPDAPGGTAKGGWLACFDFGIEEAPFTEPPSTIADQWAVSADVILKRTRKAIGHVLEAARAYEARVCQDASEVVDAMRRDVTHCFTPSQAEVELCESFALSSDDPFPWDAVKADTAAAQEQRDSAEEQAAVLHAQIVDSGMVFADCLTVELHVHGQRLIGTLVGPSGGVVSILRDATAELHAVGSALVRFLRMFVLKHKELALDHDDLLGKLECEYQITEDHLAHAGTKDDCVRLCKTAMQLLQDIEKQYVTHHGDRMNTIEPFGEEFLELSQTCSRRIAQGLGLMSPDDVMDHNARGAERTMSMSQFGADRGGPTSTKRGKKLNNGDESTRKSVTSLADGRERALSTVTSIPSAPASVSAGLLSTPRYGNAVLPNNIPMEGHEIFRVGERKDLPGYDDPEEVEEREKKAKKEKERTEKELSGTQTSLRLNTTQSSGGLLAPSPAPVAPNDGEEFIVLTQGVRFGKAQDGNVAVEAEYEEGIISAAQQQGAQQQQPPPGNSRPTSAEEPEAPSPSTGKKKKKSITQQKLTSPTTPDAGGEIPLDLPPGTKAPVDFAIVNAKFNEHFALSLRPVFEETFHRECIVGSDVIDRVSLWLRNALIPWTTQLARGCRAKGREFCMATKEAVEEDTAVCIRRHYRRAPTLQSQVYELRVRELENASRARATHLEWLKDRVDHAVKAATTGLTAAEAPTSAAVEKLSKYRDAISKLSTLQAVDTAQRADRVQHANARAAAVSRLDTVDNSFNTAIAKAVKESETYRDERLKSFAEGGDMSEHEKTDALAAVASILEAATKARTDVGAASAAARAKQLGEIDNEVKLYDERYDSSVHELTFFSKLQETLAAIKGKAVQTIGQSQRQHRRLEELVDELEKIAGGKPRHLPKMFDAVPEHCGAKYDSTGFRADSGVQVDAGSWEDDDTELSARLRRTAVDVNAATMDSTPVRILTLLDKLRQALYSRGLFLNALSFGLEFTYIAPETYIDPAIAIASATAEVPTAPVAGSPGKGGKGGAGGKPPAAAKATPVAGATVSPTAGGDSEADTPTGEGGVAWDAFAKTQRAESQFATQVRPLQESLRALTTKHFTSLAAAANPPAATSDAPAAAKGRGKKEADKAAADADKTAPVLTRVEPYGKDEADVSSTISRKVAMHEQKVQTHVSEEAQRYRDIVQRVQLALQRVPQELLFALAHLSQLSTDRRVHQCSNVFGAFYFSLASARRGIGAQVRGSMAAPANRSKLADLDTVEVLRHARSTSLIAKYEGILLRELQHENRRFAGQAAQGMTTLFSLLMTMVTPDHVTPGEAVIVGRHKNLKKLIRLKNREEAAKSLDTAVVVTEGGKGAAAGAKGGKKPDPKKDQPRGQSRSGRTKEKSLSIIEEDIPPPIAERQLVEYSGIPLNVPRCFEGWQRDHKAPPQVISPPGSAASPARGSSGGPSPASPDRSANPPPSSTTQMPPATGFAQAVGPETVPALRPHYAPPAQWEMIERASRAPVVDVAATKGGKAAKAPKTNSKTQPAMTQQEADAPAPTLTSAPVLGPRERLFQSAWLSRQQAAEAMAQVVDHSASDVRAKTASLMQIESEWGVSWKETVASLRAEKI